MYVPGTPELTRITNSNCVVNFVFCEDHIDRRRHVFFMRSGRFILRKVRVCPQTNNKLWLWLLLTDLCRQIYVARFMWRRDAITVAICRLSVHICFIMMHLLLTSYGSVWQCIWSTDCHFRQHLLTISATGRSLVDTHFCIPTVASEEVIRSWKQELGLLLPTLPWQAHTC